MFQMKPTWCRHFSFKNIPWLARGSRRVSYKERLHNHRNGWLVFSHLLLYTHFVHQQPGAQVEKMSDALDVKLCKPVLNCRIVTTRWIKSTCYHHFPVKLLYNNMTYFLKICDCHLLYKGSKIKCNKSP